MNKIARRSWLGLWTFAVAATVAAQQGAPAGDWPYYHGDLGSTQYSALDQITAENFADLRIAWRWDSPDNQLSRENRMLRVLGYKSTPIEIDDVLYVNTSLGVVAAIDAKTGAELWRYDTDAKAAGRPTNLGFNSRAVAYWKGGDEIRIFQPSTDAFLWAIDGRSGKPFESFGEEGRVDLTKGLRREVNRRNYTIMSSPIVVGDVVIVGSSISDGPTRTEMPPGDVRGYDVRTGEQLWVFESIPQKGQYGNNTWEDGSWEYSGNTNVWTNMSADPELGYVYLPFGTPTNDWYGGHRKGHNLFAESIVCVDARTGERVWHFQLVHHGLWDYDIPAAPTLFDLEIDGVQRKGVAVVTKQAFTYVFDRVTGEPIWPIEERPVPQSDVPGERSALTQPFPTKPPPFDLQGALEENLIDFSPELRAEALEIFSRFQTGPLYTPPVVITDEVQGTIQLPGWGGGANWTGAAIDPDSGMLYVPSATSPISVGLVKPDAARSDFEYIRGMGHGGMSLEGPRGLPLFKPPYGRITAQDLKQGTNAWTVPNGDGIRQQIIDMGLDDPGPLGSPGTTGPVLTKTLLVVGQGARASRGVGGASEPVLRAIDKKTGETIAELTLPAVPSGTPMTYMSGGKQYIAFAVSGDESGIIAMALP
ncbi:MAG: pyrroloquinoline quinone-dependent dehydrogenase [Acidobacteria bacterium]|nr:MAG: pyrroloquinoline quinone-dependent dehydrogenase [Acidobacteriota bacterium]REK11511.1 MAG: pyrroloquinoline quinone-dependent dehydrogenase [Acidobacteriota bacterium]